MIEKLKAFIRNQFYKISFIKSLKEEVEFFHKMIYRRPGHYYSPIVSVDQLKPYLGEILGPPKRSLNAIDFNEGEQMEWLNNIAPYYEKLPYVDGRSTELRYTFDNTLFEHSDAIHLFGMLNHLKPRKIIEVGSGYSSAVMLDTNSLCLNNSIEFTFIEPYPEDRLNNLLKPEDKVTLHVKEVQQVPPSVFEELDAGDMLFIDSTHVCKTGSDVNYLYFEILPKLKPGVIIHIHDIFYSFEYPEQWIVEHNRGWNEIYLLRAFFMYNSHFKMILFSSHMESFNEEWYRNNMPLCLQTRGQSIWFKKVS